MTLPQPANVSLASMAPPPPSKQVLAKEGVVRYDPLGDPFDPNLHDALFEVPDATKEPGTVAVVVKVRRCSCGAFVGAQLLWVGLDSCPLGSQVTGVAGPA